MSKRKSHEIVLFIIFTILINYAGKAFAEHYSLPVWMDSFGTVLAAYVCDPFCGAVVGIASNVMYGFKDPLALAYGLTSITIGFSVGISAKKKLFESLFGTLTASVIVTMFSVMISTPINLITNGGMVGNMWGNGVVSYLLETGMNPVMATIIGEFYVDFLDKVITMLFLFALIRVVRFCREKRKVINSALLLIVAGTLLLRGNRALASDNDINNNNIQVIYSSENGLPCGEANDVIQTNDGILWIGTYAGLYRYNGNEFRLMNEYASVRNVNCLFVDAEGRLWIGTNDNGLSIAIHEKISNVVDMKSGLPANSVRSITMSANGNYYIGTTSSMIILSLKGGMNIIAELPQIVYAHRSAASPDGKVAAVTNDGGLYLIDGETVIAAKRLEEKQEIYSSVAFDEDGVLYVGTTSNRVICYDVTSGEFRDKEIIECRELNNINKIHFAENGAMYVCSDSGVGYLDEERVFHVINMGEFNNSIDNMTVDYQGNLWFSSSRLGLLKMSRSPFTDVYRLAGMKGSVVNAVTKWKGYLYVGTDNGLDVIDPQTDKELVNELTNTLNDVRIRCLRVDSKDRLWICTYGKGLFCVAPNGEYQVFDGTADFGNWARVAIELSDGTVAASCDVGLGIFKNNKLKKVIPYENEIGKAMILCLAQLPDGKLLCGTDGDGIAIVKDGVVIGRYSRGEGLSSDVVLRITEDPVDKGAYIVTSNGLCYLDAQGQISILSNFPYYNNYDVWAMEDGQLFVLSSAGIYVTTHEEIFSGKERPEYELLDAKRGLGAALTANSWDYLEEDGELYLSCDNGVFSFNIHDYGAARRSYRMMVSAIFLDGVSQELERGETFHVGREVAKIEIHPEVINYAADDPTVMYYLEGFDTVPNFVQQSGLSSIVYTNIPSGEYKFHLGILDSKNEKMIEESVFHLVKENEIYDTRWFRLYMLIVAMLAVAWLTWFIARTQIQRTINFQKKELDFQKKELEMVHNQLKMGNETILAIAKTVDAKDENTSQHSQRVSDYSVLIAEALGFTKEECENIRKAALLHDIGKIGIPDRVLNKAGKLDDKEYEIMKSHVTKGAEILKDFTLVEHAIEGTKYHHERFDGKGYPQGLKGEKIPLYGRIICVADAFDAMTANRVYRTKRSFDYVLGELKKGRGTQFDPKLIDILFGLIRTGKIDVDALYGMHVDAVAMLDGVIAEIEGQEEAEANDQDLKEKEKAEADDQDLKEQKKAEADDRDLKEQKKAEADDQDLKEKEKEKAETNDQDLKEQKKAEADDRDLKEQEETKAQEDGNKGGDIQ